MKSRKLTSLDKERIIESCLTKISDKISEAEDALKEAGVKAVRSLFPKGFSPTKEQETWYPAPTYLYFADPVTRGVFSVPLEGALRVPNYLTTGRLSLDDLASPVRVNLEAARKRLEELHEQRKELRKICGEVLHGINTTKQLQELWPDGKEYYGFLFAETSCAALTVPVEKLTEALKQYS